MTESIRKWTNGADDSLLQSHLSTKEVRRREKKSAKQSRSDLEKGNDEWGKGNLYAARLACPN